MTKGKIAIDKDRCKGCGYCVDFCPKKCITMSGDLNKKGVLHAVFSKPDACIACKICAQVCPDICVEVYKL